MTRLKSNGVLLGVALLWGSTFAVQKVSGAAIDPLYFNALRFLIGGICVVPIAFYERKRLIAATGKDPLKAWKLFAGAGVILAAATVIQHMGILGTSITNAGFLTTLYVPLTPLLAITFFARRPHWVIWPAAMGCLIGTWALSGGTFSAFSTGDLLVIGSAVFWSLHILVVSQCMDRTGAPMTMATVQFLAAASVCFVATGFASETLDVDWASAWWMILFAGILATGVGFTGQVVAQKYAPPSDAAIMLSMEAVFAAFIGLIVLGDHLTYMQYLGCALIFMCVLAVELIPNFQKPKEKL